MNPALDKKGNAKRFKKNKKKLVKRQKPEI